MNSYEILQRALANIPQNPYPSHSRIHSLHSFNFPAAECFVKRDDELGFGISGSKIRKYRSLIPFFMHAGIREVVVIGSAYSNHVLGLTQLLIENQLKPTLFLRGDPSRELRGNLLLTSLFVSPSSIQWFSKSEWKEAGSLAAEYAKKQPYPVYALPEGGFCSPSLPGALTLPIDIMDNEKALGSTFDHILIDAGTGFMASSLILGLSWLNSQATVHVILLAEDREAFLSNLKRCHEMFMELMQMKTAWPHNFVLHLPEITGGFGQVNGSIFQTIQKLAQEEGFLTDPIYSAKLFMEGRLLLKKGALKGKILFHHSGGALTLNGFQDNLIKLNYSPDI